MKTLARRVLLLVGLGLLLAASAPVLAETSSVQTVLDNWHDAARNRDVPVKIYHPSKAADPLPVIIFSHGLGGTRDGYEYLGRHWASHGYVSVHVQHLGSDDAVWKDSYLKMRAMRKAAADPINAINRPKDVSFVIDQLERLNREDPIFRGRLDLNRIGVGGHSFGAFTTLAVAGETFITRRGQRLTATDPRVKAAMPMSAPVPRDESHYAEAFGSIRIPCYHMTGTLDESPINDTTAAQRRIPYDHANAADQYLITFNGADHMVFSGRGRMRGGENDPLFQELIKQASQAFWDAYLKGDANAKAWLVEGGLTNSLGANGVLETKAQ